MSSSLTFTAGMRHPQVSPFAGLLWPRTDVTTAFSVDGLDQTTKTKMQTRRAFKQLQSSPGRLLELKPVPIAAFTTYVEQIVDSRRNRVPLPPSFDSQAGQPALFLEILQKPAGVDDYSQNGPMSRKACGSRVIETVGEMYGG